MRLLLDTSVVLRLLQPNTPMCQQVIAALDHFGPTHSCCIVPQVLYEFWVVATRPVERNGLGFSPEVTTAEVQGLTKLFPLLRDERAIYERWQQLVTDYDVKGKTAHDTRIVAAMYRHGVTDLLTFNVRDFQRYDNISVHSPAAMEANG